MNNLRGTGGCILSCSVRINIGLYFSDLRHHRRGPKRSHRVRLLVAFRDQWWRLGVPERQ
jgi:hypothetical protein